MIDKSQYEIDWGAEDKQWSGAQVQKFIKDQFLGIIDNLGTQQNKLDDFLKSSNLQPSILLCGTITRSVDNSFTYNGYINPDINSNITITHKEGLLKINITPIKSFHLIKILSVSSQQCSSGMISADTENAFEERYGFGAHWIQAAFSNSKVGQPANVFLREFHLESEAGLWGSYSWLDSNSINSATLIVYGNVGPTGSGELGQM